MKTKYLFMSMVLPAVLAACSNDDFVEKTTISTTDDGRALVGDVVLKTTFPEDASTRLDWGVHNGAVSGLIEPGVDQIGAVQIDSYNEHRIPRFELSNVINTNVNYWLETADGEYIWKSASPLNEGNYLFYLNYNKDMLTRSGMYDVVDPVQYAEDEEGNYDRYNALNDQYYLGYEFLEAGEGKEMVNEIGVRLTDIHSMVGVKATLMDGSTPVKIKKIAIKKADSDAGLVTFVKSFVNGANTYAPMTTRVDVKPAKTHKKLGFLDEICLATDEYMLKENKEGVNITKEMEDDYDALMRTLVYGNWETENLTYQYELNFPDCDEATLSAGESVSGYILMPTCNFSRSTDPEDVDAAGDEVANMIIAIYTDKGMFEVPMLADYVDLGTTIANVSVVGSMSPMNADNISYYEIRFNATAASNTPRTFTVNNTTDLMEHLSYFDGVSAETTLHLYAASSDVRMNQEVYNFLARKSNIKLTLESGQLVIDAGLTLSDGKSPLDLVYLNDEYEGDALYDELKKKVFDKDVPAPIIVVEGDYTTAGLNYVSTSGETLGQLIQDMSQGEAPNIGLSVYTNIALPAIQVAEGGKLTVTASVAARVEVAENAQLVINGEDPIGLLSIKNEGTADINSQFAAINVYNGAGADMNVNANSSFSLYNDRDMKMNDNCCLNDENAFTWVWGKVTIATGVDAYLYGLEYKGQDQMWYGNWGIIENNGTIRAGHKSNDFVGEPTEVRYCINHGRLINNGTVYDLYNDGYVDNDGILYLAYTTKWSYIDVTDSKGLVKPNTDNEADGAEYVYNAAVAASDFTIPAEVTTLIVSSEVVVDEANNTVTTIILEDGADLSGTFTATKRIIAEEGSSTLSGVSYAGKLFVKSGANVTIADDTELVDIYIAKNDDAEGLDAGTLNVTDGTTMTYNGEIENHGIVNVLGNAVAGETGTYNEFTKGEWNGNNDPRPLVSYATFYAQLKSEVKEFINDEYRSSDVSAPAYGDFTPSNKLKEYAHQADISDMKAEFNKVLDELAAENVDALYTYLAAYSSWLPVTEVFEKAEAAYEHLRDRVLSSTLGNLTAVQRYAATELTDEQVAGILESAAPYRYIWKGCKLDEVLTVMANGWGEWTSVFGEGGYSLETIDGVKAWLTNASKYDGTNNYGVAAKEVASKYLNEFSSWEYIDNQVAAFGYKNNNKLTQEGTSE